MDVCCDSDATEAATETVFPGCAQVTLSDGNDYVARVVGVDDQKDIAVLQLDMSKLAASPKKDLVKPIRVCNDPSPLQVGGMQQVLRKRPGPTHPSVRDAVFLGRHPAGQPSRSSLMVIGSLHLQDTHDFAGSHHIEPTLPELFPRARNLLLFVPPTRLARRCLRLGTPLASTRR